MSETRVDMIDFSIILPVYNQADHLESVLEQYLANLSGMRYQYELILVVNGNEDGSLDCCRRFMNKKSANIKTITSKPGWGKAVRAGLAQANGKFLCYTNLARTPAEILVYHLLVAMMNPDVVIKANRKLRQPFIRKVGSVLYNFECRFLFDLPTWDLNGTPKVFHRKNIFLSQLLENRDLLDLEFIIKCREAKISIIELPVVIAKRNGGKSTTNFKSAIGMYWGAIEYWRNMKRNEKR